MLIRDALLIGLLFLVPSQARAAAHIPGAVLLEPCPAALEHLAGRDTAPATAIAGVFCLGYGSGIAPMQRFAPWSGLSPICCWPEHADMGHVIRVVLRDLREHPEHQQSDGMMGVTTARREAFPCPARPP
jgi:Rap1a immunity proteins